MSQLLKEALSLLLLRYKRCNQVFTSLCDLKIELNIQKITASSTVAGLLFLTILRNLSPVCTKTTNISSMLITFLISYGM